MNRSSLFTLAYAVMLGAAGPLAACASNGNNNAAASSGTSPMAQSNLNNPSASSGAATTAPAQTASPYTDAQLQSFIASRAQIQQLTPGQTAEAQAANQQRIAQILAANNLPADTYTAIEAAARTDQALANRIAATSVGTTVTDAQLQSFVAASAEIDPLNRQLATATPEQRTQIAMQIRSSLERNNLTIEAYNGIAARAQSDPQLGARIAQLRGAQPAPAPG
jgi:hypothetical protein